MQSGYARSQGTLPNLLQAALQLLVGRDAHGAALRRTLFGGAFITYWFLVAMLQDFPSWLPEAWLVPLPFLARQLLDYASSFFAPSVLAPLLPIIFALLIALRLGARYLTDLFELESPSIASRYLLATIFGLGYQTLEITSGSLDDLDQRNPLLRIGGPGYLTVHLGFAAVFEAIDGSPRVYAAAGRRFIEGFEQLRDVVDMRDQHARVEKVHAVTRDGIEVMARDAQIVFRVHSGGVARSLQQPYPFTESAVRRLVYGQAVTSSGARKWADALPLLISQEISSFVSALTIEEFLALQPDRQLEIEDQEAEQPAEHIMRRQLTEHFHNESTRQRLQDLGLEIVWVGVGTWEVRSTDDGAGETLIATWRDLQRALLYRDPEYLQRQQRLGFEKFAARLLRDLIRLWNQTEGDEQARCWNMLAYGYYRQLLDMQRVFALSTDAQLPPGFEGVLNHLRTYTEPDIL